jgi:hypothetical protein
MERHLFGRSNWEGRAGIFDWHIKYTPWFQGIIKKFGINQTLDSITLIYQFSSTVFQLKVYRPMQSLSRAKIR